MSEQRKLATIMAIDVAGYSRAAETDDGAAAEAVSRLRGALDEVATAHGGRLFSTAGDGFMVEFPAVASGIAAAQALLTTVQESALPRIRIGLHLGDVIVAPGGDLLGHGVNVAARLQAMAEPNTAVVSQAVQMQLRQAADVHLRPLGRVQLDKMSAHIEVFALAPKGEHFGRVGWRRARPVLAGVAVVAVLAVAFIGWRTLSPSTPARAPIPRLAVLRFENLGDTEPYFAEGVADELISEVSRIRGLEVTARASSFALAGDRATPANAAHQLGATLVLTGSARKTGNTLRVQAQLVRAPGGQLIWDQTFERPTADVYGLQRDIAVQVARAAGLRVIQAPPRRIDPEAFELYLRGREAHLDASGREAVPQEARDFYSAAVERDPTLAEAWAQLGWEEWALANQHVDFDRPATPVTFAAALRDVDRALALKPELWEPYAVKADVFTRLGQWREAEAAGTAAEARGGFALNWRWDTGAFHVVVAQLQRRATLNPQNPGVWYALGNACLLSGETPCAVAAFRRTLDINPEFDGAPFYLFLAQVRLGSRAEARRVLNEYPEAWRRDQTTNPLDERRFLSPMIGDGPQVSTAELLALYRQGGPNLLDDIVQQLGETGRAAEAAPLLADWNAGYYSAGLYDPPLAPLRRRPEFWALMQRRGLLAYWRESGQWPDFCAREPVCPH